MSTEMQSAQTTLADSMREPSATPDAPRAEASPPEHTDAAAAHEERQRIERQLRQLKRKEAELRRALIVADHPQLSQPILEVDGRVYAVQQAADRLDSPLTKSEAKKQERLGKKLASLQTKRAALDASIAELETELAQLGEERLASLTADRDAALQKLFVVMGQHAATFDAAGIQVGAVVPDLERWLPAIRAMAEEHAQRSS